MKKKKEEELYKWKHFEWLFSFTNMLNAFELINNDGKMDDWWGYWVKLGNQLPIHFEWEVFFFFFRLSLFKEKKNQNIIKLGNQVA